jgi:oligopeptide/dipeptide ABC transporter ATP-binding protein
MVFQDPMSSLNPVHTVGSQIAEVFEIHGVASGGAAGRRTLELLERVGIPDAARRARDYPHEFSGGMRQRVMIAMALACDPKLLIADEPTTALDVTIQAQIVALVKDLRRDFGMSVVWITHDLGVVADLADQVVVMYAGRVVERAPVIDLFARPRHPYTQGLFASLPRIDQKGHHLTAIEGTVPSPTHFPEGCRFRPRCPLAVARCHEDPPLEEKSPGHLAACWVAETSLATTTPTGV